MMLRTGEGLPLKYVGGQFVKPRAQRGANISAENPVGSGPDDDQVAGRRLVSGWLG